MSGKQVQEVYHKKALKEDFKKIAPIWGIIVGIALISILLLKFFNNNIINYIQYPPENAYLMAKALAEEGTKYYLRTLEEYQEVKESGKTPDFSQDPNLERCKTLFLKSLDLYPENVGIYNRLATISEIENDPVQTAYYQAMVLIHSRDRDQALILLNRALDEFPDSEVLLETKTRVLIDLDLIDEAENTLTRLFAVNENSADAHYHAGRIWMEREDTEKAEHHLDRALNLDPRHLKTARLYGTLLVNRGDYEKAIKVLKRFEEFNPNNARLKHAIGRVYYSYGKYQDSYRYYILAEKLEKNSAPLYLDLTRVCRKLGKDRMVSIYMKRALDLDPGLKDTLLSGE